MSDLHDKSMDILHEAAGIKRNGLAGLLGWIQERHAVETVQRREIERLLAEVRDLKARLKAVRRAIRDPEVLDPVGDIERATDLRVKNWRTP